MFSVLVYSYKFQEISFYSTVIKIQERQDIKRSRESKRMHCIPRLSQLSASLPVPGLWLPQFIIRMGYLGVPGAKLKRDWLNRSQLQHRNICKPTRQLATINHYTRNTRLLEIWDIFYFVSAWLNFYLKSVSTAYNHTVRYFDNLFDWWVGWLS